MRISQIVNETSAGATGSGSVATVSSPLGATQSRNASIYGDQKVGNLLKGKKTNKPFANSINEGKEERERNAKLAQATDYEKRAKATKNDIKKAHYTKMADEIRRSIKTSDEQIAEAKLEEDDKIIPVGKGHKLKTGLHGKDRKVTALSKFSPPFKAEGLWVSDRRGKSVLEVVEHSTLAAEVAAALNAYITTNEVTIHGAGAIAGGIANEAEIDEGAKVDRMVKHIAKSERKLGHSKDEAEDIAWATANKRGYLDNKNKKKGK